MTGDPDGTAAVTADAAGLHGDTNGLHWAETFTALFDVTAVRRDDGVALDVRALMLTWFCNAIETGLDAGAAEGRRATYGSRDVKLAMEAARTTGRAEGREAERQRIRQLAIDNDAIYTQCDDGCSWSPSHTLLFADLLDGAS